MAGTTLLNSIDPSSRKFERFDTEIHFGSSDSAGRLEVLRIHTKNMELEKDFNLEAIASETDGYVGADIASLCFRAAMQQNREKMSLINLSADIVDAEVLNSLAVTMKNQSGPLGTKNIVSLLLRSKWSTRNQERCLSVTPIKVVH
jgi:transitional endoplasmic reticulum ATPase